MTYYIAYGSNLNLSQMKKRCLGAKLLTAFMLENYELEFKKAPMNKNAYATITPSGGKKVPAALFSLTPKDEDALDLYEDVIGNLYYKKTITVQLYGENIEALVYIMNLKAKPMYPKTSYINTILQGYKDHGFNEAYLYEALNKVSE